MTDLPTLFNRRAFLGTVGNSFGAVALSAMLNDLAKGRAINSPFFAPKAKRVIYLFQSGGPSHVDLFDAKPSIFKNHEKELPPEVRDGQRVTGMTAGQGKFPIVRPTVEATQCGDAGIWLSNLLPYTQKIANVPHPVNAH